MERVGTSSATSYTSDELAIRIHTFMAMPTKLATARIAARKKGGARVLVGRFITRFMMLTAEAWGHRGVLTQDLVDAGSGLGKLPRDARLPPHEIQRSMAASAVGGLADAAVPGSFISNTVWLSRRRALAPARSRGSGRAPAWSSGVLPEPKYQAFRHDLLTGAIRPSREWTAHELCHGLIGFAWRPDATPFFMAIAARWRRPCPWGSGTTSTSSCAAVSDPRWWRLHGAFCRACEAAALGMDPTSADRAWWTVGAGFVEREVEAAMRSAEEGRMVHHRPGNLDLASDGVAYAGAHRGGSSPEFARFIETFFRPGEGLRGPSGAGGSASEVLEGILEGDRWPRGDAWTRVSQDVGWRLLTLSAELGGESAEQLDTIIDELAERRDEDAIATSIEAYTALNEVYELPAPEAMFAVGYDPAGHGRSIAQISEGLRTACPRTVARLGEGPRRSATSWHRMP